MQDNCSQKDTLFCRRIACKLVIFSSVLIWNTNSSRLIFIGTSATSLRLNESESAPVFLHPDLYNYDPHLPYTLLSKVSVKCTEMHR